MAEYGSGITMVRAFALDKERIKHALTGELLCGEDEDGTFIYEPATKEECDKYILGAFDNAVYHCRQALADGVVLEGYLNRAGIPVSLLEFAGDVQAELAKYDEDYEYEVDDEDEEDLDED